MPEGITNYFVDCWPTGREFIFKGYVFYEFLGFKRSEWVEIKIGACCLVEAERRCLRWDFECDDIAGGF